MKKVIISLISATLILSALGIVYVRWDKKEMRENLKGQLLFENFYRICRYNIKSKQITELTFDGYEDVVFINACGGFNGDYYLVYKEDEKRTVLHIVNESVADEFLLDFCPKAIKPYKNGVIATKEIFDAKLREYESQGYYVQYSRNSIYYVNFVDKSCNKIIDNAASSIYGNHFLASDGNKIAYSDFQYYTKKDYVCLKSNVHIYENDESTLINIDKSVNEICGWLNENELLFFSNEKLYSFNVYTNKLSKVCKAKVTYEAGTLNASCEYYVCSVFADLYHFINVASVTDLHTGRKIRLEEIRSDGWNNYVWINE